MNAPTTLRRSWWLLDRLVLPQAFWWIVPLAGLGALLVVAGWSVSLPVVLPGDEAYAIGRVVALSARSLTGRALPIEAPPASALVAAGATIVLAAVLLGAIGLLLRVLRAPIDLRLIAAARALALVYSEAGADDGFARPAPGSANRVRLGTVERRRRSDDVVVPFDRRFLDGALPRCAGAVRELIAVGAETEQNLRLARALMANRAATAPPLDRLCLRIDQRPERVATGRDAFGGFAGRAAELRLTSLPQARCRRLLREQPPIKVRLAHAAATPCLVVVGLGDTGFELLCRLLPQAQLPDLERLVVVLVDAGAAAVEAALLALSPQLALVARFVPVPLEARLPESAPQLLATLERGGLTATCVYLASDERALVEAWHRMLELAYRVQGVGAPLLLRVRFATERHAERALLAEDDVLDAMPRDLHARYLERAGAAGYPASAATVPWERLPFDYQEDNRTAADHYWMKAHALGFVVGDAPGAGGAAGSDCPPILPARIEALAQAEHRRWLASRAIAGWRYAPVRNDANREHPSMRPWEALDEPERDKDRDIVRDTATALRAAGYLVRPLITWSLPRPGSRPAGAGDLERLAAVAIERARASATGGIANLVLCVEDVASFARAQTLSAIPELAVSLVVARSLASFGAAADDSTLAAQRLAESAFEIWQCPEHEFDQVLARWPAFETRPQSG